MAMALSTVNAPSSPPPTRLLHPCRGGGRGRRSRWRPTASMGRRRGRSGDAADAVVRRGRPSLPPRQLWRLSSAFFCQPLSVAWAAAGGGRTTLQTSSSAAGVHHGRPVSRGGCPRRFFASRDVERREEACLFVGPLLLSSVVRRIDQSRWSEGGVGTTEPPVDSTDGSVVPTKQSHERIMRS